MFGRQDSFMFFSTSSASLEVQTQEDSTFLSHWNQNIQKNEKCFVISLFCSLSRAMNVKQHHPKTTPNSPNFSTEENWVGTCCNAGQTPRPEGCKETVARRAFPWMRVFHSFGWHLLTWAHYDSSGKEGKRTGTIIVNMSWHVSTIQRIEVSIAEQQYSTYHILLI